MADLLFVFGAGFVLGASYFIFRVAVHRDYRLHGRLSLFSSFLEFLAFSLHATLMYFYFPAGWPEIHVSAFLVVVAAPIAVIGLAITLFAMSRLGFEPTFGRDSTHLSTSILYRISRNPQIVGYGLFLLAYVLLWPSWYAMVWFLLYLPIAHMMVITEEEHLAKRFGPEYANYCRRVSRYVPFRFGRQ